MPTGDLNLNIDSKTLAQCLKAIDSFGHTTYVNICNGQHSVISWGGVDWFVCVFLCSVGLLVFCTIVAFFWSVVEGFF